MIRTSLLAYVADELLREHGQNREYPYLTRDRMRRIAAHEFAVADIDAAMDIPTEVGLDRLRTKDRERLWEQKNA